MFQYLAVKPLSTKVPLLFIFTLIIASCGGSDGSVRIKGTGGGGSSVAKSIISTGTLNNTGTLSVNGTAYDVSLAEVFIDNRPGIISDLQIGQVVSVDGNIGLESQGAIAESIYFDTSIQGSVTEVSDNSIIVLEQEIIIYDNTYFRGLGLKSIDDLGGEDILKLSGYPLSDGRFVATYVERLSDVAGFSIVTGNIASLDSTQKQFSINKLLIDYSGLMTVPVLMDGLSIKVSGEIVNTAGRQQLKASRIELRHRGTVTPETLSETQGFVTRFFSPVEFEIDGKMISANSETEYLGGQESDLEQDIMLEVEGLVDAEGVVNASRIIFLVATLNNVTNNQRLYEKSQDFVWNNVAGAEAYKIFIKNTAYDTLHEESFSAEDVGSEISVRLENIPDNGSGIIVLLQTKYSDTWFTKRYDFSTPEISTQTDFVSHRDGDTLKGTEETFVWRDVNAKGYALKLSSGQWQSNHSFSGLTTQASIGDIPGNSATIQAELRVTDKNDYTYTKYYTFSGMAGLPYARLSSHRHKGSLDSSDVTFTWNDVGADGYEVSMGNAGFYTIKTYGKGISFARITGLPVNGTNVHLDLKTIRDGAIHAERYHLFTANLQDTAELISHKKNDVLASTTTTFEWNDADADKYVLRIIGGFYDNPLHHQEYRGDTTSVRIDNLPNNCSAVRVYLWTYHRNYYRQHIRNLISPCERENAALLSHKNGDSLSSTTAQFQWSDVGADEYHFSIVSDVFGDDAISTIYSQYLNRNTTFVEVNGLPENGVPIKVELRTRHGKGWHVEQYTLNSVTNNTLVNAKLISHKGLDELAGETVTFTWSDVGADEYNVVIVSDDQSIVFEKSFRDGSTAVEVANITNDIRFNLNTRHGNGWHRETYILYAFSNKQTAILTSHKDNDKLSSSTATFEWSDVQAAEYSVRVTSGFAGNVLFEKTYPGDVQSVTLDNLPDNCANLKFDLYTTYSLYGRRSNYSFLSPCNEQKENAVLLAPEAGDILSSTSTRFRWNNTGADEYHLRIRSSAKGTATYTILGEEGDQDYYFSGDTSFVDVTGLPDNSAFLEVQLKTRYGSGWHLEYAFMTSAGGRSNAELTSHTDGETLVGDTVTFEWTDVGADEYGLFIQDADDATTIFDGRYTNGTTAVEVGNMPANTEVFLNTRYDNAWHSQPYVFFK